MPWNLRHNKNGGYDIVRTATGEVVGHSTTKRNAALSIWHRKKAEGMLSPRKKKK